MDQNLDIAIVGLAGRFPGAPNIDRFWDNLCGGREAISFFSEDELLAAGVRPELVRQDTYVRAAPVLDDVDAFDERFFGYSPREASAMDPQHRLLLEEAWHALEHAGYDPDKHDMPVSVFAGSAMNTYLLFSGLLPQFVDEYLPTLIGNDKDFLATRISYKLNLKGPSVTVQTACSTSLVAVHMACQSLLNDECDMALAGGVSVRVPHTAGHLHVPGSVFTPDGHCRPFDAGANGTIFGSGVGVVVLKRLEDALADNDAIHALIKGSAINNDGAAKTDYTAPSIQSQADAVTEALAVAGVDASTISYVEAHGTGTYLGDPIEVAALTRAYRAYTEEKQFCRIGSVKSNIGHLDAAAGMAGLIKTVLSLKRRAIPPSLHFDAPNPEIDFDNSPFVVNDTLTEWKQQNGQRRAGINSLGIGGTNAHVILEEAPVLEPSDAGNDQTLFVLSAKTPEALDEATQNLAAYLEGSPGIPLADAGYTLQVGRKEMAYRRILVCKDADEAISLLRNPDPAHVESRYCNTSGNEVVFMFTGQGAQYANMTRQIYEMEPVFKEWVDRCAEGLLEHLDLDLRTLLYPSPDRLEEARELLNQTRYTQPALFTVEFALAQLWMSWGIEPAATIGHSIGEYVAACLAGVFDLGDALSLVASRGELIQAQPPGAMLSVPLPYENIQEWLDDSLSLAAVNTPVSCVVAGESSDIDALSKRLAARQIESRRLVTSHAFHSAMMEPALDAFAGRVAEVNLHPPEKPFISTLSGDWITAEEAIDPEYWVRHIRQTVQFSKGLQVLMQESGRIYLEIGPGQTLTTLARQHGSPEDPLTAISCVRHPLKDGSDQAVLLRAFGKLWLAGAEIDWKLIHGDRTRRRIPLPTYPFQKNRHWYTKLPPDQPAVTERSAATSSLYHVPIWKQAPLSTHPRKAKQTGQWLFFVDESGLSDRLADFAVQDGVPVTRVRIGKGFKKVDGHAYELNPSNARDYESLIEELVQGGVGPARIVYAWSLTKRNEAGNIPKEFYSLLYLAQALGAKTHTAPIQIDVLSTHLEDVIGSEVVNPEKALLLGPCKVIPLEYPHISCRNIDLDPIEDGVSDRLIELLMEEFRAGITETAVAYRVRRRWVMESSPVELPDNTVSRLRKNGIYLITGGLGGLGLEIAEYLAENWQARLLLTSRAGLPPRENWDTHHDASTREKIDRVLRWESFGAEVIIGAVDVASEDSMREFIDAAERQVGPIEGVVHAAGIVEDAIIQTKSIESVERVLAPKVTGTRVIDRIFHDKELDWLVLFSSIASITGAPGQVDYCAGNAFMDAYARASVEKTGRFVISINWTGWKHVGMASRSSASSEEWLEPAEGVEAFTRILSGSLSQVIVSPSPPSARFSQHGGHQVEDKAKKERTRIDPDSAPRDDTETTVARIWGEVLGIPEVGIHDDFFEFGGSSLLATQLISRLTGSFEAGLTIQDVFNAPTVAQLSERIKSGEKKTPEPKIKAVSREAYRIS